MPKIPKAHSIMVTVPPANTRDRNSRMSTIGCAVRDSITPNAAAATAASANAPRISGDVQPLSWPSISA